MWFSITNKNDFLEFCKGLNKASIVQMDPTRVKKKKSWWGFQSLHNRAYRRRKGGKISEIIEFWCISKCTVLWSQVQTSQLLWFGGIECWSDASHLERGHLKIFQFATSNLSILWPFSFSRLSVTDQRLDGQDSPIWNSFLQSTMGSRDSRSLNTALIICGWKWEFYLRWYNHVEGNTILSVWWGVTDGAESYKV